ncbi:MAG: WG repeat-containing protein [Oscillospiraceae bacterium]|nr:WG repeat-containing protein [Oscillospiraceae bacterium]
MKKIIALILAFVMMLVFAACEENEENTTTTESTVSDMTEETKSEETEVEVHSLLVPFGGGGIYGYCTVEGKVVIGSQYNYAELMENGIALVKTDEGYGYINSKNEWVVEPEAEIITYGFGTNEYAVIRKDGKDGLIDKTGAYVVEPKYEAIEPFDENGLAFVRLTREEGGKAGYINKNGEFEIEPIFGGIGKFAPNGLAYAHINYNDYGYINLKGEWVIEQRFGAAGDFASNGLAPVMDRNANCKYGYINSKGEWVIEPQFDNAEAFAENGLACVEVDGKCGYINEKGEIVIEPQFEFAEAFSKNGLAAVCGGGIWEKKEGVASVDIASYNGKWGYINEKGEIVIDIQFLDAESFDENGLAKVQVEGIGTGYITADGKRIEPKIQQKQ